MYAVIRTGGKQYKVAEGDELEVEHLFGTAEATTFTPILVVTDKGETIYSQQTLKEYSVSAKLLGDKKGDKVTVFKYRNKTGYAVKNGHRQLYSMIQITSIGKPKKKAPAKPTAETVEAPESSVEPSVQTPESASDD
ncbi:MAG: 50S ribosomal protein L21 [Actinomycetota bacterium]